MASSIWPDICGFVMLAVILFVHRMRTAIRIMQNTLYVTNMMTICMVCLTSAASIILSDCGMSRTAMVFRVISVILGFCDGILWLLYVASIVNVRIEWESWLPWLVTPLFAISLLVVAGSFKEWFFVIRPNRSVAEGPLYMLILWFDVFMLACGLVFAVIKRRYLSRERLYLIPLFAVAGIAGMVMQAMFLRSQVMHFTLAICAVIFFFSLPDPGEFYDDDSPMFNMVAFHELYNRHFEAEDTLYCVAVVLRQTRYIVPSATKERKIELETTFLKEIQRSLKGVRVFRFKAGQYLVTIDDTDKESANRAYRHIGYVCSLLGNESIGGIPLHAATCPFVCPQDVISVAGVGVLLERLQEEAERRNVDEIMPTALGLQSEKEQRKMIRLMRSALKENRLEIFYQPIYSPEKGRFTSAEALIRMRNEEGGFISPGVFIPLAEQNGLIIEIGDFVLDEVCKTIRDEKIWEKGIEYIEVNLSVTECIQNDLVDKVRAVLRKYGLSPKVLNLEITETASDSFSNTVDNNIRRLHEYGLSFSLDDFGTGYSSLNRILNLPLSIIKLDMSLVRPAFESKNPNAMTLLRSSVGIAKSVGTEIVAEGVETKEMAEGIIALGVEHIQGFYYARPLPKQQFIELLAQQ